LIAIAVVAYAIADVVHEALGHGGACVLTGGQPRVLSTVHFECSADNQIVLAGGTIANLIAGGVAWAIGRSATRSTAGAYFWWLFMTVNLLQGAGYFLFSGVANIGDWAGFINGLEPVWAWRAALTVIGAVLYTACVWFALRELIPFIDGRGDERVKYGRRLTVVPYVAGGIVSCLAGLFNPVGMLLVGISAAAASFGGTSGLAWMWQFLRNPQLAGVSPHAAVITRSRPWIISAVIVAAIFVGLLGRGVRLG